MIGTLFLKAMIIFNFLVFKNYTEPSTITTKDGRVRNGSLIYTIRPFQEAMELNYQRQFLQAERDMERAKAEKRLAELNRQSKKEESA